MIIFYIIGFGIAALFLLPSAQSIANFTQRRH
jgi:F0F1-type ATP synthase assembly protein I